MTSVPSSRMLTAVYNPPALEPTASFTSSPIANGRGVSNRKIFH
jgi:hypothetical protein